MPGNYQNTVGPWEPSLVLAADLACAFFSLFLSKYLPVAVMITQMLWLLKHNLNVGKCKWDTVKGSH
eukprot:1147314-Pelagomonas_calceolata.AAC.3